jgi:hypothetical protein
MTTPASTTVPLVIAGGDLGQIKLGNQVLPGAYQRMTVSRAVRMEEKKAPGKSGSSKQPRGFEDAEIELVITCHADEAKGKEASDQAATIISLFQLQDRMVRPFVYEVTNAILDLWKIREVVFKGLSSADDNQSDLIVLTLQFTEHRPVMLRREKRRAKTSEGSADPGGAILTDTQGQAYSVPTGEVFNFMSEQFVKRDVTKFLSNASSAVDDDNPFVERS